MANLLGPRVRLPALLALSLGLAVGGCGGVQSGQDAHWLGELIEPLTPPSPGQAARDAFNVYDADKRRQAIALLAASPFGHEEPYLRTYRLMLDDADPDPTVRAASIKALGMHGSPEDALRILPFLEDRVAYVRWEAAEALKKLHEPAVVDGLLNALKSDPDADVRMAAAEALGQYAQPQVFDTLVGALRDNNFGVARAAAQSLAVLTGRDHGNDPAAWMAWARDRRDRLFADQLPYSYQPYQAPPGWFDQVQFWREPETVPRERPAGLEPRDEST